MAKVKKDIATNTRKSARTKYLPHIDVTGGYMYSSRSISLLNEEQQAMLPHMGTIGSQEMLHLIGNTLTPADRAAGRQIVTNLLTKMTSQGLINPAEAQALLSMGQRLGGLIGVSDALMKDINATGQSIVDAFNTNTHHMFMASAMLTQPIYMGGAITAANKMADIGEQMTETGIEKTEQEIIYNTDNTYWLVVSLKQKQRLATNYLDLVKKLNSNVHKMIDEGVATRADGLKVDVKLNEAEMQITQVEDGLALSKMLLCQLCGIPMNQEITLADEDKDALNLSIASTHAEQQAALNDSSLSSRPELRLLQNVTDASKQATNLVKAAFLPHVALTGGYMISNPNVWNGFQKNFTGVWNVGVLVQIPVWNWGEGAYKVRAAKATAHIAQMNFDDTREKIQLQVTQSQFKVKEAEKKLNMARKNINSAEENLRCANLGFKEGVMDVTDVMAAQTAWQQAQSQKIDAEIDVKLTQVGLNKALGILR